MKPIEPQKLEDINIKGHNTFIKIRRASDNGNNTTQKTGGYLQMEKNEPNKDLNGCSIEKDASQGTDIKENGGQNGFQK